MVSLSRLLISEIESSDVLPRMNPGGFLLQPSRPTKAFSPFRRSCTMSRGVFKEFDTVRACIPILKYRDRDTYTIAGRIAFTPL